MTEYLFSYYGDDFTGSTDVMESLDLHGVKTVLFTRIPTDEERQRFKGYNAVGIAGTSRSETPGWMDENLPRHFEWLKSLDARFCHYKVCSTFDSAPHIGSIGRAIDISAGIFRQQIIPLVVGVPQLKRYTAFGHLFAAYMGQTYRIDRHPVMSRHPVTPMGESDLRIHLAHQTTRPVTLVPANALSTPDLSRDGILLFDVLDAATQLEAGRQLLSLGPLVVGSSGINYAIVKALITDGTLDPQVSFAPLERVDRIIAVSGSCSPTTARQIRHALANGYSGLAADPVSLASDDCESAIQHITREAIDLLKQGRSVLVYTAHEPETGKAAELDSISGGRHRVGQALGRIARDAIAFCGLKRAIIAGGDTSSHALGQLDVLALTTRFPLRQSPGSPLCRAHSNNRVLDGIDIAMKGGQVGGDDYFTMLRDGT
jgi:3-oxoisoapionate kinase